MAESAWAGQENPAWAGSRRHVLHKNLAAASAVGTPRRRLLRRVSLLHPSMAFRTSAEAPRKHGCQCIECFSCRHEGKPDFQYLDNWGCLEIQNGWLSLWFPLKPSQATGINFNQDNPPPEKRSRHSQVGMSQNWVTPLKSVVFLSVSPQNQGVGGVCPRRAATPRCCSPRHLRRGGGSIWGMGS